MITRRSILPLLFIFLLSSNVLAFKNEPKGWSGWLWGTSYSSVSKYLAHNSSMSGYDLYDRPGDPSLSELDLFLKQNYAFKNGSLVGMLFVAIGTTKMGTAVLLLSKQFGVPDDEVRAGDYIFMVWYGKESSMLTVEDYKSNNMLWFLGNSSYVKSFVKLFANSHGVNILGM